jgi:CrcB protein
VSRFLVVALGGAFGAMSRYGVSVLIGAHWRRDFPIATLLINVTGSFILGLFSTFAAEKSSLDPLWRLLVATGFVGAYTTFSTFEYETQRLAESGALWLGVVNVLTSVAAGFAAVQVGVFLARR